MTVSTHSSMALPHVQDRATLAPPMYINVHFCTAYQRATATGLDGQPEIVTNGEDGTPSLAVNLF